MGQAETFKPDVMDGCARASNHSHHLRQPRCNDFGRRHLFSQARQIVEHPAWAIEIPLTRAVHRFKHVLHPVSRGPGGAIAGGGGRDESKETRSVERDRSMLCVHALDREPIVQPPSDPNDFNVPKVAPERRDVARGVNELFRWTPEEVTGVAWKRFDAVFPLLRQPCPRATRAVDEKLAEIPPTRLHLRDIQQPGLETIELAPTTALETAAPAQNNLFARPRGVDHRSFLRSRILRTEFKR